MARDMTLFVDDDGKAYQIYSSESNSTLHFSQLTDDFLKPAGKFIRCSRCASTRLPPCSNATGNTSSFLPDAPAGHPTPPASPAPTNHRSVDRTWQPVRRSGRSIATTFSSQSTFVLPVPGKKDAFIFMADRWNPGNAIDGRYIWLPIQFKADGLPVIEWKERWDLGVFQSK